MIQTQSFDNSPIEIYERFESREPKGMAHIFLEGLPSVQAFEDLSAYFNARGYMAAAVSVHSRFGQTTADGDIYLDSVRDMAYSVKSYAEKFKGIKHFLCGFGIGSYFAQGLCARYAQFLDGAVIGGEYLGRIKAYAAMSAFYIGSKTGAVCQTVADRLKVFEGSSQTQYSYTVMSSLMRGMAKMQSQTVKGFSDKTLPILITAQGNIKNAHKLAAFYKKNNYTAVQITENAQDMHQIITFFDECRLRSKT